MLPELHGWMAGDEAASIDVLIDSLGLELLNGRHVAEKADRGRPTKIVYPTNVGLLAVAITRTGMGVTASAELTPWSQVRGIKVSAVSETLDPADVTLELANPDVKVEKARKPRPDRQNAEWTFIQTVLAHASEFAPA